jgi:murein L,D-transpeptidase YcbB/YkuD
VIHRVHHPITDSPAAMLLPSLHAIRLVRAWATLFLIVSVSAATGCRHREIPETAAALQLIRAGSPVAPGNTHDAAVWTDVREFYKQREGAPAWVTHLSTSKQTADALQVLRTAPEHGLISADYGEPQIVQLIDTLDHSPKNAPDRLRQLAGFDARLTTALFALGRDVATGRTTPERIDRRWKARRKAPDFVGTLSRALETDLKTWLEAIRPSHPEYVALQKALADLRERQANGGWPRVPAGAFTLGKSHPSVIALRRRLAASGSLAGGAATNASPAYDKDVEAAVRALQAHHGLKATGIDLPAFFGPIIPGEQRPRASLLNSRF